MPQLRKRVEPLIILSFLFFVTIFLLKLPYLSIYVSTPITLIILLALSQYLKARYMVRIPSVLLLLLLASVEVDAIGNHFNLYGQRFVFVQYDEISHCLASALFMPAVIWALGNRFERLGYQLPLSLLAFFGLTIVFTLAGFYEVIELWDDKYLHPQPGMRIHGPYDTPNDLQWNLLGMVIGAVLSNMVLKSLGRRPA